MEIETSSTVKNYAKNKKQVPAMPRWLTAPAFAAAPPMGTAGFIYHDN